MTVSKSGGKTLKLWRRKKKKKGICCMISERSNEISKERKEYQECCNKGSIAR
jgi:hypothetical protein